MADARDQMTERMLRDSGLGIGMRVLDVGCGVGDVSLMIARLVGESGHVVGLDCDTGPLDTARRRVGESGLANTDFVLDDLCDPSAELGLFDAVVGRRVLMYQRDPREAVRRLCESLHPGGIMAFQEHDSAGIPEAQRLFPLHERVQRWIWDTVEREGADLHMGLGLYSTLSLAGLQVERVTAEAVVQTPESRYPFGAIVRAMLPRLLEHGVATAEEIDLDTLDDRLAGEVDRTPAVFVSDLVFSAWGRKSPRAT